MRSPTPSGVPGGDGAARRRAALGRFWIAVVLILLELGLGALAGAATYWSAGVPLAGLGFAPFLVTGVSAGAGTVVLAVLGAANRSAARAVATGGPPARAVALATLGQWLASIRLVALLGAAALVSASSGGPAGDLAGYGLFCFATIAALFAVLLGLVTARGIRR